MISMAHTFKMQVLAEGTELIEQIRLLHDMDRDIIQGYGISPPCRFLLSLIL